MTTFKFENGIARENAKRLEPSPLPTTTPHGPRTAHVDLSRLHAGQIVTPIVEAYYAGRCPGGSSRYLVVLSWHDASDGTINSPVEHTGDFWDCTRWLAAEGVHADIDAA